jgi:lipoprotein-anchoring transpeptidase ErfK/SrfK
MPHIVSFLISAALAISTAPIVATRSALDAARVPPVVSAATLMPPDGPLSLYASLSQRTLYVRIGDSVTATFPVAIGKDDHPTPTGTFRISKIVWNPEWVPPRSPWARDKTAKPPGHPENPMKLVKIFFREPDYYVHGTSEFESLGSAASHGCLRMLPDEAASVARWLMEHGGNPKPESWFRRILRFRSQEQVVYLQNPISLTIEQ